METSEHQVAPEAGHYAELLSAVRGMAHADAAALLRLDGEVLVPVAVQGLSEEALGRRFLVEAHPRLALLLRSPQGRRLPADCALPDPYDGLVAHQPEILPVHDCMGAPLALHGRPWGLLTLDALQPGRFEAVQEQLPALARLVEQGVAAAHTIRELADRAEREHELARELQTGAQPPRELLGRSPAMQRLRREIDTVAPTELTVLILGETGVGKELVAQRLHARSLRRERALVQVNCAALPESLADSELFGHRRGAFTGATQARAGRFQLADGGTLFLDEVGELSLPVQAKLLRVLQSGEVQRPGSDELIHVDVRVIAATNRDLAAEVAAGRFRADLYHRLSVYPLHVPPLRQRGRDVLALAEGFMEENQHRLGARNLRLSPASKALLLQQPWPGNVRELEHLVSRAALRARAEPGKGRWIAVEPRHLLGEAATPSRAGTSHLPVGAAGASVAVPEAPSGEAVEGGLTLREATERFQREWIRAVLARHGGSLAAAAREAGMDRSNFHRLARRLGLAAERRRGLG
ncbi:nitric oxide reductase transcriptional regulator NorR [Azohydromonas caseinilytica]|uniref:Nitric oxide reductase transcriptional regulator NorR n=1 Tax=Azohydromonas caseinilytica TaxID=2728836 RepID=A0A848FB43_9BURK|nr:nitric oxide reductase transcriptional regulator NorR [Azohydromonas caseinilytica]NML15420.1 nitric oxide reductase transcriptional regulator NorR [Azohydromonas caseinilytica]